MGQRLFLQSMDSAWPFTSTAAWQIETRWASGLTLGRLQSKGYAIPSIVNKKYHPHGPQNRANAKPNSNFWVWNTRGELCASRVALWTPIEYHAIQSIENQQCTAAALSCKCHYFVVLQVFIKMMCWLWSTNFGCPKQLSYLLFVDIKASICGNYTSKPSVAQLSTHLHISATAEKSLLLRCLSHVARQDPRLAWNFKRMFPKKNVEAVVGDSYMWYCCSKNRCIYYCLLSIYKLSI